MREGCDFGMKRSRCRCSGHGGNTSCSANPSDTQGTGRQPASPTPLWLPRAHGGDTERQREQPPIPLSYLPCSDTRPRLPGRTDGRQGAASVAGTRCHAPHAATKPPAETNLSHTPPLPARDSSARGWAPFRRGSVGFTLCKGPTAAPCPFFWVGEAELGLRPSSPCPAATLLLGRP